MYLLTMMMAVIANTHMALMCPMPVLTWTNLTIILFAGVTMISVSQGKRGHIPGKWQSLD